MNKTAIKNFAIWARVQLIEAAKQRAYEYEITEKGENKANLDTVAGRLLTSDEKQQRQQLIEQIRRKGYAQVMEEAAYTWFNRFIALRFMEVNGFLPSKVRVFTDETGAFKPEIMKEAMTVEIDGLDRAKVLDLLDKQNNEELYKYLLITQCNALNEGLPCMFEKISNWTELLFPANLLRPDSVVGQMVSEIPEEDWLDAVQIIGWLYQYYNSELKDDTFALLKKNVKITKERIPAATQLFTPDWIVRYMVENSLGRLYINDQLSVGSYQSEAERVAAEKALAEKMGWKYYLPEAEQDPEVRAQLNALMPNAYSLTTLKVIDPCMGSGHILVYAFDVLLQIYTSCGWSERDAAKSIIENNLYGLDIDDRAGQLAYFAVMMKARKYNRRILNGEVKPNVLAIQDSGFMTDDFIAYVAEKDTRMKEDLTLLRSSLKDAKEYGSILHMPKLNFAALYERIDIISRSFAEDMFQISYQNTAVEQLLPLVKQAEIMAQKYDAVVTNPPYMGGSGMSNKLADFVKKNYPDSKSDLFAVFIEKCGAMLNKRGYQAMITQHAWMFLSSFEKLRTKLLAVDIVNMAHLGARAFEEIGGEVVQTTSFVIRKSHIADYKGEYCRLIEPTSQQGKEDMFLSGENRYAADQSNFSKIPGSPVAYWLNSKILNSYKSSLVGDVAYIKKGMFTGANDLFFRLWFEPSFKSIDFGVKEKDEVSAGHYVPMNSGGAYRRWFGNRLNIIKFDNLHYNMITANKGHRNPQFYFQKSAAWTKITTGNFSLRISEAGFINNDASMAVYEETVHLTLLLGLLNSKVAQYFLRLVNESLNYTTGNVASIPFLLGDGNEEIELIVHGNVKKSKDDWDSYETSWDFKRNPLV